MTTKKHAFSVAIVVLVVGVFASSVLSTSQVLTITPIFLTTMSTSQYSFRDTQVGYANTLLEDNDLDLALDVPMLNQIHDIQGPTKVKAGGAQSNIDEFALHASLDDVVVVIVEEIEWWNGSTYIGQGALYANTGGSTSPPDKHIIFLSQDANTVVFIHELLHMAGIEGHSDVSTNIMYGWPHGSTSDSSRDMTTDQ